MSTVQKDWITKSGLRAVIVKNCNPFQGDYYCGYVGIDKDHPLYGVKYYDRTETLNFNGDRSVEKMSSIQVFCALGKDQEELRSPEYVFEVHGGLTYSDNIKDYPVESDLWWFGYDCSHCDDTIEKCNFEYCVAECESLAKQIAKVKGV